MDAGSSLSYISYAHTHPPSRTPPRSLLKLRRPTNHCQPSHLTRTSRSKQAFSRSEYNRPVRKLIEQILKFGVVGAIAFVIDWGILNLLVGIFHMHNVIAGTISFFISLVFNYFASMKYVFKHRPDMARWMEMAIFLFSSLVGLFLNGLIIWLSTYGMNRDAFITQHAEYLLRTNMGKLVATVIVAIWNFIIRKWLLDDTHTNAMNRLRRKGNVLSEEELEAKWEKSFSHRLGMWSIEHTPKGWE